MLDKIFFHRLIKLIIFSVIISSCETEEPSVIIDSNYTFEEAVKDTEAPQKILDSLRLVTVEYYSFDGLLHQGQLVVHQDLENDVMDLFKYFRENNFPIRKVIPIVQYGWDDDLSLLDDNSSSFNYREITGGGKLSNHSLGRALDLNPLENPYIKGNIILPPTGVYEPEKPGTFVNNSSILNQFISRGWDWGGNWITRKDYQHFEKVIIKSPL